MLQEGTREYCEWLLLSGSVDDMFDKDKAEIHQVKYNSIEESYQALANPQKTNFSFFLF
jgi:hypothetical protein